jgi:hypothetical protein
MAKENQLRYIHNLLKLLGCNLNMVNQTMKFDVGRILDPSVVSKWIWWMGMIIRFTFVEGIILNRIIELIL